MGLYRPETGQKLPKSGAEETPRRLIRVRAHDRGPIADRYGYVIGMGTNNSTETSATGLPPEGGAPPLS